MREAHTLSATKTMAIPRRMIYFDSESKTNIAITDEEVRKIEEEEEHVWKRHDPYMICATFKNKTNSNSTSKISKSYVAPDFPELKDRRFLQDFWQDVDDYARMNEHLYLFAHNAKYDVQVTGCVHYLIKLGYKVTSFSDENPFILTFEKVFTHSPITGQKYVRRRERNGKIVMEDDPRIKTIVILSSTNYYQQSLASLGKVFKLDKLDFDHGSDFDIDTALIYCKRDVEILQRAMDAFLEFVEKENLGTFKMTIAGQAFAAFRHRFMHGHTIYIHADPMALHVERQAYAGGRTECFRMGKIGEKVYYVDVNSMYAHVMKEHLYPSRLVSRWEDATVEQLTELIKGDYLVAAEVYVETDKPIYHKKQKRLIFPVGGYWTTLCTPELIKGIPLGLIKKVRNICIYEADNFFERYIDYFYTKRLEAKAEGDSVHDLLYKSFLTNLYGKFGQKNVQWEAVAEADPEEVDTYHVYHADTRKREVYKVFGGHVWRRNDDATEEEAYNSFPAIAAHVTAYARMLLWDAIETAGIENVFYSDTDSIMCNEEGYNRLIKYGLISNSDLGKLKLEKIGELELFGCKDYKLTETVKSSKVKRSKSTKPKQNIKGRRLILKRKMLYKTDTKIKGVSKSAKMLEPTSDGRLRFAVTQWGGFTERLKSKDFSTYHNKVIIKTLKRTYNKGVVDGDKIKPYSFDEESDERVMYKQHLADMAQSIFTEDYIMEICRNYGFIKVPIEGERYFREYKRLHHTLKRKYFRKNGIPTDIWTEDNGKTPMELFDELNTK